MLRWRAANFCTKTKSTARESRFARNYLSSAATRGAPDFDNDVNHTETLLPIKVLSSGVASTKRTTFTFFCEKSFEKFKFDCCRRATRRLATESQKPMTMEVQLLQAECLVFASLVQPFVGGNSPGSTMYERRLVSLFGFDVQGLACLHLRLVALGSGVRAREHVLWALFWLRSNNTEAQCVAFFRSCTEKTFRLHVHHVVRCISQLGLVCYRLSVSVCCIANAHFKLCARSTGSGASRTGRSSAQASASTVSTALCRTSATRGGSLNQLETVARTGLARSSRTSRTTPRCATSCA